MHTGDPLARSVHMDQGAEDAGRTVTIKLPYVRKCL
jgi:hypothetical protein